MKDGRWVQIAASQFNHEQEGLEAVKQALPDAPPFRAWANFEFRDSRGRWHEVDLLVLARDTLYLIELKHYRGILTGNDHLWKRNGRTEDSPLLLARRKAQYFASLLKDSIRQRGGHDAVRRIPYVQELVFLHRGMREVILGALPAGVTFTARAASAIDGLRQTYGENAAAEHLIVRLPPDSTGRWWTWAGTAANRTLQASLQSIVDPRQRIDEKSVRLLPGLSVEELSSALATISWQNPGVDSNALRGLKFSTALPESLAIQTLSARLGDQVSAERAAAEPRSIVRDHNSGEL